MDEPAMHAAGGYITDAAALNKALEAGRVGAWRWRIDTNVLEWSGNLEAVHGLAAGEFDGTLASFQGEMDPSDSGAVWEAIQRTLRTGESYHAVYRVNAAEDEDSVWMEASGGIAVTEDGVRYLTGVCMDVTARRAAERELERRLRQQRAIELFGTFAFGEASFRTVLDEATRVAADVLSAPLAKILQFAGTADHLHLAAGVGWRAGLVGNVKVGIGRESQAGFTLIEEGPVIVEDLRTETRFSGPQLLLDHGVRSGLSVVIPGPATRPFGVFGVHDTRLRRFNLSDGEFLLSLANIVANAARHHEEAEHRLLLVREMAHRAGNMLQLVSTIANQTFSGEADTDFALRSFNERLGSLSRANYLIARGGWTSTRVGQLFADTLRPFIERIDFEGRDVLLPPDLCFDLGLMAHELATNSAKYGSLAAERGKAQLSWGVTRIPGTEVAHFTFAWRDPRNTEDAPGTPRLGFGSRMLSAIIESKWGGRIQIERENGYCFSASVPFTPA